MTFAEQVDAVFARLETEEYFGIAFARKSGRNPKWPHVPVILTRRIPGRPIADFSMESQIRGLAYATREEAIACAQRSIEAQRAHLRGRLNEPRYRALRESFGLPTEIPTQGGSCA